MTDGDTRYRICNACKTPISFNAKHYVCSVSTCTRKRTGFVFCSVACWETHVPVMRHRDAWAVEAKAPSREQYQRELAEEAEEKPAPRIVTSSHTASSHSSSRTSPSASSSSASSSNTALNSDTPEDILIVASKLKAYIRARSGMNTSDGVMEKLSDLVRSLCDDAIREAGRADRKTVMDRDFKPRE